MFTKTQGIITRSKLKRLHIKRFIVIAAFSIFATFCISTNTHAAGIADVKEIFNAAGDGVTDDTAAIQAAFNSDYDTIIFREGEYKYTTLLTIRTSNKTILGEKATLFFDDDYTGSSEFSMMIWYSDNITIKGLGFQGRDTEYLGFSTLIGIRDSSNIHFDSCDFQVGLDSNARDYTTLDFWTGWSDVSVENSQMGMLRGDSDDTSGCIFIRDIQGRGGSGMRFVNNVIHKFTNDEAIWLSEFQPGADLSVEDVEISGNRVYLDTPDNMFTVAFSTRAPGQLKNIRIFDNEIIGRGMGPLVMLQGGEDVDIFDNDLHANVIPATSDPAGAANGSLFGSRRPEFANTPGTVKIRNNRTASLEAVHPILSLSTGVSPFDVIDNPRIIVNAPFVNYLVQNHGSFVGNDVIVNGSVERSDGGGIISVGPKDVRDNNIYINGYADVFIRNWRSNLTIPANYTGNTIITTKKRPQAEGNTGLAVMWSFAMNGYPITISNNTFVNGAEVEDDESLELFTVADAGSNIITDRTLAEPYSSVWNVTTTDISPSTSQTAEFCNNTIRGFRTLRLQSPRGPQVDVDCE